MTQKEKVKQHLNTYGTITDLEAFKDYAIRRLAAVIYNLKNDEDPLTIDTEIVTGKNRFNEPTRWARYTLID